MKKIIVIILLSMVLTASILLSPAVAGAEAATRSAVVVSIDDDTLTMLDGAGLFWQWNNVEDFNVFDIVSFQLIDTAGTDSILDDSITQPIYAAIRVDKEWIIRFLVDLGEIDLAVKLIEEQASA